jgi:2-phosphoxylose phosphatase
MLSLTLSLLTASLLNALQSPDYCSHDMQTRRIPDLAKVEHEKVEELKQVQVVIRHGARTPYSSHPCWKGYDIKWSECSVSEYMFSAPTGLTADAEGWFFRKVYDGSPNELGGNCQTGQLLAEGYEQEVKNGNILKDAYIGSGSLKLFNTSVWEDLDSKHIYLRSDDEQRTLASGQILVHSLFELRRREIIDWHTGDYALDTLSPNRRACPQLEVIEQHAFASSEYQAMLHSNAAKKLEQDLNELLGDDGEWSWNYLMDCLMTTVCTGRQIPGEDAGRFTQDLFDAAIASVEYTYAHKSLYNNSYFSKLAMINTASNIKERIVKSAQGSDDALKFALYGKLTACAVGIMTLLRND